MKNFVAWKKEKVIPEKEIQISQDEFVRICHEYFAANICGDMKSYYEHRQTDLTEAVETSRYSVEINYRTTGSEVLDGFAKICLGYVSAALKKYGYHTKHVFDEKPIRLLVSSRNWDDGEWTGVITWHQDHKCFVISKGFYNKDRRSVSIQSSKKCDGQSAADLTKELHNQMHHLKDQPDRHVSKLKPVPLKRGPKS